MNILPETQSSIKLICGDCLEILPTLEAGSIDAIITDPPYGIDAGNMAQGKWRTSKMQKSDWDKTPANLLPIIEMDLPTVIFGGNYFQLPPSRGWVIWDKGAGFRGRDFAECEMIWSNLDVNARVLNYDPLARGDYKTKEHPTQKPVAVMKWIIERFTKEGETILDPFCGSGSTGVACVQTGRNFIGIEKDAGYFAIAEKRIKQAQQQMRLGI